jgi:hypothetical protein
MEIRPRVGMLLSFVLSMLVSMSVHARDATALSQQDIDTLRADVQAMTDAFERGDAEPMIELTHSSLKAMAGGPDAFAAITWDAVVQLRAAGVSFISQEIGTPTQVHPAGDEDVCFVPRVSVAEIQGRRMKSTTYMVAIRPAGGGRWTYLDGAGLRKHPGFLHQLLPDLDHGIALPPNTLE